MTPPSCCLSSVRSYWCYVLSSTVCSFVALRAVPFVGNKRQQRLKSLPRTTTFVIKSWQSSFQDNRCGTLIASNTISFKIRLLAHTLLFLQRGGETRTVNVDEECQSSNETDDHGEDEHCCSICLDKFGKIMSVDRRYDGAAWIYCLTIVVAST